MKEKIYDDPYKMGLIDLVLYYNNLGPERLDRVIKNFLSVRTIVVFFYKELVWRKEMKPLEDLTQSEKERFWNKVKDMDGNKAYKVNLCRCYYLFEIINK